MRLTIVGCSDAFGSGGRNHSCYLLDTAEGRLMIDCGANSPLALKRAGISMAGVGAIVISHCHGDHFGGLPFLFLDKMFIEPGSKPLQIIGPQGIMKRTEALIEDSYPGLLDQPRGFEIIYRELSPGSVTSWSGLNISAFEVEHYSGTPSLALAFDNGKNRFSFSGDSSWCQGVIDAGRNADLYLIDCTEFSGLSNFHLDYITISAHFDDIGAKRYLLTHMSEDMLKSLDKVDFERCIAAEDGLTVDIGSSARAEGAKPGKPGFRERFSRLCGF